MYTYSFIYLFIYYLFIYLFIYSLIHLFIYIAKCWILQFISLADQWTNSSRTCTITILKS